MSDVIKELEELEYSMLEKWDFEATRKLTNDIFDPEFLASLSSLSKTVSEVIRPAMDRFYANNLAFNIAVKSMMEVFHNIQIPKVDYGVPESIKGISDTFRNLDLPSTLNGPSSEEDDEE